MQEKDCPDCKGRGFSFETLPKPWPANGYTSKRVVCQCIGRVVADVVEEMINDKELQFKEDETPRSGMKDRFGIEISIGDLVVHAYNTSGAVGLCKGKVVGFTPKMVKVVLYMKGDVDIPPDTETSNCTPTNLLVM